MFGYTPDWPLIGEILKGSLPIAITGVVALVAWRQWEISKEQRDIALAQRDIANNKLVLDLFDRRLKAFQTLRASVRKRVTEVQEAVKAGQVPDFVNGTTHDAWELFDDAYFLFGDEVRQRLADLDMALTGLGTVKPGATRDDGRNGVVDALYYWSDRVMTARHAFRAAVEPYMAIDTIGVAKPHAIKSEQPEKDV